MRVAIIDVGFFHENGMHIIFQVHDDVLFVSRHADPMMAAP
jgi:acetoin utilization deacetylase AcuC-like enzyme